MMAAAVDTDQSSPVFHHCHSDTINSHVQFPQVRNTRNSSLFILTLYGEPGACRPRREKSKVILNSYLSFIFKLILGTFNVHWINIKNGRIFCFSITPTVDQSILMSLLIVDGFNMVFAIAYQCCFYRCGPECRCKCPWSCSICHQRCYNEGHQR